MGENLKILFKTLEECVQVLEDDLKKSLAESKDIIQCEGDVVIDRTVDHHFKEIVTNLSEIKTRIGLVAHHERIIENLRERFRKIHQDDRKSIKIDKTYIQKQVQAFSNQSNENVIVKRRNKGTSQRFSDSSPLINESMKTWQNYLDKKEEKQLSLVTNEEVIDKRPTDNSIRKKKKFVSSTVDLFLESDENVDFLPSIVENAEIDTEKPRIIDVIYKTNKSTQL